MTAARTPWAVTALIAIATFASMFALSTLIDGAGWLRTVFLVLAAAVAANLVVRAVTRSRFLPSLAALGAAVIVMVPLFAVDEEGAGHLLPTPSALGDLWQAFVDGADYAATTPAPANVTTPLVALITAFAISTFVLADHLAASWRAVAVSGIVLMLPWTPAIFLQYRVPLWALFATAACWMVAMGVARSTVVAQRSAPVTGGLLATGVALLTVVLVAPAALGGTGWGAIPRFNAPPALDTSTRLNLDLDLRNSLTVNSTRTVLTYVSSGQHPDALRVFTLRDFDGSTWTREKDDPTDNVPASSGVLWPANVSDWATQDRVILSVDASGLSQRNLPLPPVPRSVDVGDEWAYSPSRDEVATVDGSTKGMQYSIVAALGYFTADGLRDAQALIATGEQSVGAEYTDIPSSVDVARLNGLAKDLTADATTQYDQAVALQDYLRNPDHFTYDTSVSPAGGGDSVSQFLDDRHGYCVQFATTMVMLSRSIGIPARLAVGFLGGHATDGGVWSVRGGDAHAWPELYFPGEGWVRFEPTPAVQTGSAPSYTVATSPGNSAPIPTNGPFPTTAPTKIPQTTAPNTIGMPGDQPADAGVPWWLLAVVVLVLAGAAAGVWALRRRSAARAAAHGPEAAWAALRQQLPDQLRWPLTLTPLEAAQRLEHDVNGTDHPFTAAATNALHALRDAVSDHRYAPPELAAAEDSEEELAARVRVVALEASAGARSRPDRVDARSAPRRDS